MTPVALLVGAAGAFLLWTAVTGESPVAVASDVLTGADSAAAPDDEPATSGRVSGGTWTPRPAPSPGVPRSGGVQP